MSNIKFKIKVVEFMKFTTNFQIKPLQTTQKVLLCIPTTHSVVVS